MQNQQDPSIKSESNREFGWEREIIEKLPGYLEQEIKISDNTIIYTVQAKSLATPSHSMRFLYFHDYLYRRFSLKAKL